MLPMMIIIRFCMYIYVRLSIGIAYASLCVSVYVCVILYVCMCILSACNVFCKYIHKNLFFICMFFMCACLFLCLLF